MDTYYNYRRAYMTNKIYLEYIETMTNFVYMLMDSKITADLHSKLKVPNIIISPYIKNTAAERNHKAIFIYKGELNKIIARESYSEAYDAIVNTPYKCDYMQEAYFAMFLSVYMLCHTRIINIYSIDFAKTTIQTKLLTISLSARKAIANAIGSIWSELLPPDIIYSCMSTSREKLEKLMVQLVVDWIIEPFYTGGTYSNNGIPASFSSTANSEMLFKHIKYEE
jgi:hypothetical protein